MKDEIITATLAGLLHDIGSFAQRSGSFGGPHAEIGARLVESWRGWLPAFAWEDVLGSVAANHARGRPALKRIGKIAQVAARLVEGGRRAEITPGSDPAEAPLAPILGRVALASESIGRSRWYSLNILGAQPAALFPQETPENADRAGYARHWQAFVQELALLERSGPVDSDLRLATLLALLRKYLWCVPAATPWRTDEDGRTFPDVSLYDHAKVTAALAACLEAGLTEDELDALHRNPAASDLPIALVLRGDLSGIQDFIFRITRPEVEAEFEDVAKRLRGRSFYLSLLGDVAADLDQAPWTVGG